jgi:hypothetical protein
MNSTTEGTMIKTTKQIWEVGEIVKVGFLKLRVLAKIPTPGDYMPDAYALGSVTGSIYRFVPHFGLSRCASLEEAISQ